MEEKIKRYKTEKKNSFKVAVTEFKLYNGIKTPKPTKEILKS